MNRIGRPGANKPLLDLIADLNAAVIGGKILFSNWEKKFIHDQHVRAKRYGISTFLSEKQRNTLIRLKDRL